MRTLALTLLALFLVTPAQAQSEFLSLLEAHPDAAEVTVATWGVPVFEAAALDAQLVMRLGRGEVLIAYERAGSFYAVARPGDGHLGYVQQKYVLGEGPREIDQAKTHAPAPAPLTAEPSTAERPTDEPPQVELPPTTGTPAPGDLAPRVSYKDPTLGTVLGILISGGGQFYAGRTAKGGVLFILGLAGPGLGYAATLASVGVSCSGYRCSDQTNYTPLYVGAAIGAAAWLYGLLTAASDVRRYNERQRLLPDGVVIAPAASQRAGRASYGLRLSYRL